MESSSKAPVDFIYNLASGFRDGTCIRSSEQVLKLGSGVALRLASGWALFLAVGFGLMVGASDDCAPSHGHCNRKKAAVCGEEHDEGSASVGRLI